jgi:hypothetical protein
MSLFAGLTCPQKLGGIFGLSSYMLLQGKLKEKIEQAGGVNNTTKIFMGHGDSDQVVRYDWGKLTADKLKEWGHEVDFNTYEYGFLTTLSFSQDKTNISRDLAHSADPGEIDDLEAFLNKVIPAQGDSKGDASI